MSPVILIVDENLGFVFWLGQIFSESGCQVVPALSAGHALSITKTLNIQADVIVVDPSIDRAPQMIETLTLGERPPKIVSVHAVDARVDCPIRTDATLERPSNWQRISADEWLERIQAILREIYAATGD